MGEPAPTIKWIGPPAPPGHNCCAPGCNHEARYECQGCYQVFCFPHWFRHGHVMPVLPPGWTGSTPNKETP